MLVRIFALVRFRSFSLCCFGKRCFARNHHRFQKRTTSKIENQHHPNCRCLGRLLNCVVDKFAAPWKNLSCCAFRFRLRAFSFRTTRPWCRRAATATTRLLKQQQRMMPPAPHQQLQRLQQWRPMAMRPLWLPLHRRHRPHRRRRNVEKAREKKSMKNEWFFCIGKGRRKYIFSLVFSQKKFNFAHGKVFSIRLVGDW